MQDVNLLALETSSHRISVAVWADGCVHQRLEERSGGGSDSVLPWVTELLREAGLELGALDLVAYGAGPGGFVGLRLACAIAQGLALGRGIQTLGVSDLEAVAAASGEAAVYACLDARMGEVYAAAYRNGENGPVEVLAPSVHAPQAVPLPPEGKWVGAGDGFRAHGEALRRSLGGALDAVRLDVHPTAATLAHIAAMRFAAGRAEDAAAALPIYVRNSVALTTAERLARGGRR